MSTSITSIILPLAFDIEVEDGVITLEAAQEIVSLARNSNVHPVVLLQTIYNNSPRFSNIGDGKVLIPTWKIEDAIQELKKREAKIQASDSIAEIEACISTMSVQEIELLMIAYGCKTVQQ